MRVAHVVVDVPARAIDTPFDYLIPAEMDGVGVGTCVLADFGHRPVVGYVVGVADSSPHERLHPLRAVLGGPYFNEAGAQTAAWIASEYVCPLSDAVRLFAPPGGTPRAVKTAGAGGETWELKSPAVGPVDDRWAMLVPGSEAFTPRAGATMQRAVLDALREGPVRVPELTADLGAVSGALKRLVEAGVVTVERRRRHRDARVAEKSAVRPRRLTDGQHVALTTISRAVEARAGEVILLDGVTGSGKTEVYLQAIERAQELGRGALVLVPEISLTPQTVGRFRSRFGDDVAVLHSRLSPGERYDQWDLIRRGEAHIVVGALRTACRHRPDRHRRGAREYLQAGIIAPLPRTRRRRAPGLAHRSATGSRQRQPLDGIPKEVRDRNVDPGRAPPARNGRRAPAGDRRGYDRRV